MSTAGARGTSSCGTTAAPCIASAATTTRSPATCDARPWPAPLLARVRGDRVRAREELDQQHAGEEAADVGAEGHAALVLRAHHADDAAHGLQAGPVDEHRPGGERDRDGEDADRHDAVDAYAGIEHQVGAHHAADGAGGADHGD